jgi:glutamate carboxypeptidase
MDDAICKGALEWLAGQRPAMERLLAELVGQNSFTDNRAGVNAVAARLLEGLTAAGLEARRLTSSRFGDHLAFASQAGGRLDALTSGRTGAPDGTVVLIGHLDTVFPPGTFEGCRIEGDSALGPGTFDMKGGLVVTLFALQALARAGALARIPVRGLWVSDEEVGSVESQAILRDLARGAACALDFESGRPGDAIVVARKGTGSLAAVSTGVAAHAGNDHEKGCNAIWSLARYVDQAQVLTDYGKGITVNVGRIEGGTTKNTVPARARCEVDLRFLDEEAGKKLVADLEDLARVAVRGTRIDVLPESWRPPLVRTAASGELAREYGQCQRASGLGEGEAPLAGGGSDASTTSAIGIPSIDGLGPRGSGYHTHEERLDLTSLVPKASALVRFLARRMPA